MTTAKGAPTPNNRMQYTLSEDERERFAAQHAKVKEALEEIGRIALETLQPEDGMEEAPGDEDSVEAMARRLPTGFT
ncbi:hypothetical protein [Modestobacter marinus]|uniref:hypothetical protein n=1 Tax=Modestobacter marinus TaxID=477641 RepID=UPI001C98D315|nr:hypothetical protein [Modestobacter marinus]